MINNQLTREENVQAVFDLKAGYTLGLADVEILKRVARMALAAMDSEPVAEVLSNRPGNDTSTIDRALPVGTQLYRHAQPVVPPMQHWEELCREYPDMSIGDAIIRAAWWNHCRAAMLQELPKSAGASNNCRSSENVQVVQVVQDVSRCSTKAAPALDSPPKTAESRGGNSPVIPDRWIPVSERMPEDRISVILWDAEIGEVTSGHYSHKTQTFYHCGDAIENEITHWMPPPCAPQEVK